MAELIVRTTSQEETIQLGEQISKSLEPGDTLAFEGNLGSGKTTLIKGIAKGLGLSDVGEVTSPTFVLMHIYKTTPVLYHFDLYRLENQADFESVGLEEHLSAPDAIKCLEWAEKAKAFLPGNSHWIHMQSLSETERDVRIVTERALPELKL